MLLDLCGGADKGVWGEGRHGPHPPAPALHLSPRVTHEGRTCACWRGGEGGAGGGGGMAPSPRHLVRCVQAPHVTQRKARQVKGVQSLCFDAEFEMKGVQSIRWHCVSSTMFCGLKLYWDVLYERNHSSFRYPGTDKHVNTKNIHKMF